MRPVVRIDTCPVSDHTPQSLAIALRARAVARTFGAMNKTEAAYANHLEVSKRAGLIHDWRFEALKLRLAAATFYTPDFLVIEHDGTVALHEVKGFWRDDARVKIKVAAAQFPWFRFVVVRGDMKRGRWQTEEVRA